jgi:hypothetical protein
VDVKVLNRRICSYDMVEVPRDAYTMTEEEQEIYLCNPRCLCLWAVLRATRPDLVEAHRGHVLIMTTSAGKRRSFENIVELAQWATANAFGTAESEWLTHGRELE